ncbi:MAG: hypothetical protein ABR964_16230 [Tepidisphaeraceae bacterium]
MKTLRRTLATVPGLLAAVALSGLIGAAVASANASKVIKARTCASAVVQGSCCDDGGGGGTGGGPAPAPPPGGGGGTGG